MPQGLNSGGDGQGNTQRILLRLRHASDEGRFFDFNHVLGTMLHEMTHNIHGPHNAAFYKLLDELWEARSLCSHARSYTMSRPPIAAAHALHRGFCCGRFHGRTAARFSRVTYG